eukprot:9374916-Ditylum_brightwellii.AAC.1
MSYQHNFPKIVVHGSKYIGVISFTHLQAYQLSAKITSAMEHVYAATKGEVIDNDAMGSNVCSNKGPIHGEYKKLAPSGGKMAKGTS